METIYKYPLLLTDKQELLLPVGANLLDVQLQGEQLCLWAIVDTDAQRFHKYIVRIEGTGQGPIPFDHRGAILRRTVQQGGMVWHVFVMQESYHE